MSRESQEVWTLQKGIKIPVKIIREKRKNHRASITSKFLLIRVSNSGSISSQDEHINSVRKWVSNLYDRNPQSIAGILIQKIPENYQLNIRGRTHKIQVTNHPNKLGIRHLGKLTHEVFFPKGGYVRVRPELEKHMMKYFRRSEINDITKRVHVINSNTVKVQIRDVKLSLAMRQWGSCSSKRNINLSMRLLLCPNFIIDYVIIHELCHTVELNHSKRFWNLVEKHCPDYKKAEKWLNSDGRSISYLSPT